jgi:hypothetical protein
VILLREGKVAADGPKERVLTSAALGAVFGSPVVLEELNGYYSLALAASPG